MAEVTPTDVELAVVVSTDDHGDSPALDGSAESSSVVEGHIPTSHLREMTSKDAQILLKSGELCPVGWRFLAETSIEKTFDNLLRGDRDNNKGLTEHKLRGGRFGAELLAQFHLTRPELLPHQLFQELIAPFSPVDPNLLTWAEFHHGAAQLIEKGPAKLHILGSFDQFDVDGDGEISTDDLKAAMDRLGEPLTYVEVNEIVGKGVYGNVKVKRKDWENTLSHILGAQYKTNDLRKQYSVLDFDGSEVSEVVPPGKESPLFSLVAAKLSAYILLRNHKVPMSHSVGEKLFLFRCFCLTVCVMTPAVVLSILYPKRWGEFDAVLIYQSVLLFVVELLWEACLSFAHIKWNVKINYTRKLGHLLRLPKYFLAAYIPGFEENPMTLLCAFVFSQVMFGLLFCRQTRTHCKFASYLFTSQDRREDRPYTMRFQITEDVLRYAIYLPFKAGLLTYLSDQSGRDLDPMIFIPITINTLGDGLAEPVGVKWGKHKYTTRSLYYNGKWWSGSFVRSYEGSSMVWLSTWLILGILYDLFTTPQFIFLMVLMPPAMTLTEAISPHTNDGPFLAIIGCSVVAFALFLL